LSLTLVLFLIGVLFIAAWAYHALRAHNAVRKAEGEIVQMVFRGEERHDLMDDIRVPETFDERRMAADLKRIAWSPTLIGKYLATAEIRFTNKQHRKILEAWKQLYNAGAEVLRARTEMGRALHEHEELNIENQLATKKYEVDFATLNADGAEARLRQAQAEKAMKDLDKKEEPPPPLLTAEQKRILKKSEIETAIDRLKQECQSKLETITDESERVETQNMYDDEIARRREELRRNL
jgi:hypothetical protein